MLVRPDWLNLNGAWEFETDPGDLGLKEHWFANRRLHDQIIVPFTLEAAASGLAPSPEAPNIVWYARDFELPASWQAARVVLRIGACDHWTRIFLNGQEAGQHRGGYSPISVDLTHLLVPGTNRLVIRVEDPLSWTQPRGKQAGTTRWPIDYDAVTGIWQTAWLEPLGPVSVEEISSQFRLADNTLTVTAGFSRQFDGDLEIRVLRDGLELACGSTSTDYRAEARVSLQLEMPALWSPSSPTLHQLELTLTSRSRDHQDRVVSYVGLREITVNSGKLCLNGEPLYLRGVLDQGYFPEGWYTAVDDHAIRRDVELTLALGFNCARKHQKAEDPRYLYWADRLGLMVWAEMPSGRIFSTELISTLTTEWTRLMRRDRNHPSIIAWVPFNESWGVWHQIERPAQRAFVDAIYALSKTLDTTRPVIGNDGWEYSSGDLWTLHIYNGSEADSLNDRLNRVLANPGAPLNKSESPVHQRVGALPGATVTGLPVLLTECGGVGFIGNRERTGDEFAYGALPTTTTRLESDCRAIAREIDAARALGGYVWTQLTDVQQEINGVLYFDRTPKLPIDTFREIFSGIGSFPD
ncbi:MAG: glycoside hydrolase family 2 protein [Pseudomonadota bacterium]